MVPIHVQLYCNRWKRRKGGKKKWEKRKGGSRVREGTTERGRNEGEKLKELKMERKLSDQKGKEICLLLHCSHNPGYGPAVLSFTRN